MFTIEVVEPGKVQAVRAKNSTEAEILVSGSSATPVHGLASPGRSVSTAGPQTAFTVINAWNKSQPRTEPLHFPQAQMEDSELQALYLWASKHEPPLMFLITPENGLTLAHIDPAVHKYAWKPQQTS